MAVVRSNEELNKYAESKAPLESPTFTGSVIVPTPTTGTQAANKDYVDSVSTLDINTLTNKATPVNTDNLAIQETGGLLKKVSFENLTKLSPNDTRVKTALNATGNAPIYACRAWVNFNGTGTVSIRASGNVSSITDNGTGDYTVNFTTAMLDANYVINGSVRDVSYGQHGLISPSSNPTTTSVRISTTRVGGAVDNDYVSVSIFI